MPGGTNRIDVKIRYFGGAMSSEDILERVLERYDLSLCSIWYLSSTNTVYGDIVVYGWDAEDVYNDQRVVGKMRVWPGGLIEIWEEAREPGHCEEEE